MKRTLLRRVEQLEALRPKQERRISSVRYATPWRGRKVPEGTVLPPGARVILDFERFCSVPSWRGHGIKYEAGILHQRILTACYRTSYRFWLAGKPKGEARSGAVVRNGC